jgi:tetratricopeptide (TPR) repeat protein
MMRRFVSLFVFFVLFLAAPVFAADAAVTAFEEANTRYQKGDFKGAAEAYEKLLATGPRTAPRFYNLGNAAFRSGKKGKALLNYRRALEIAPRDEDARWSVLVVQSTLTDRIAAPENPIDVAVEKITAEISANEAAAAFAGTLALWALVSFAAFAGARGGFFGVLRLMVVVAALISGLTLAAEWHSRRDPRAVVLAKEVVARYGPSMRETKAFILHEGAEVRIADRTTDWVYVTLQSGSSGWIPRDACEAV